MTSAPKRRPLPALVFLIALTLLTALVWWRVLHRGAAHTAPKASCTPTQPVTTPNELPRSTTITLSVLNSTERAGIAKSTGAVLKKDGFTVSSVGNDTGHAEIKGVGEIRYIAADAAAAKLVSYYLPGAKLVVLTKSPGVNVVVSLGSTYKKTASPTAVKAALTKAHLTIAPSPTAAPVTRTTTTTC